MKYIPKKKKTLSDYLSYITDMIGNLSSLKTDSKSTLVEAINEAKTAAGINPEDIVDNCTSEDSKKVLSANQGRVLKNLIETGGTSITPTAKTLTTISDATVSMELGSDKHYIFNAPTSLTITGFNNTGQSTSIAEFTFELNTGTTATKLTLPSGLKYAYYIAPVANSSYLVSIYNDVCVMLEVATR